MSKSFDPIVVHPSVQTRPPCGPLELDKLARTLPSKIPDELILDRDANEFAAFAKAVCDALAIAKMPFENRIRMETGWGYTKIIQALRRLGLKVSRQTVRNVLVAAGLGPEPHDQCEFACMRKWKVGPARRNCCNRC